MPCSAIGRGQNVTFKCWVTKGSRLEVPSAASREEEEVLEKATEAKGQGVDVSISRPLDNIPEERLCRGK